MKRIIYSLLTSFLLLTSNIFVACDENVSDAKQEKVTPQIYPDYLGVTIPVNIAPLCFNMVDETALRVDAVITDSHVLRCCRLHGLLPPMELGHRQVRSCRRHQLGLFQSHHYDLLCLVAARREDHHLVPPRLRSHPPWNVPRR